MDEAESSTLEALKIVAWLMPELANRTARPYNATVAMLMASSLMARACDQTREGFLELAGEAWAIADGTNAKALVGGLIYDPNGGDKLMAMFAELLKRGRG